MKQGMNSRRSRNRGNARGGGGRHPNPRNQTFDSNGPEGRIRGTANQVYDRYCALARDAQASGDWVLAENLQQHAEHYFRILNANAPAQQPQQHQHQHGQDARRGDESRDDQNDGDQRYEEHDDEGLRQIVGEPRRQQNGGDAPKRTSGVNGSGNGAATPAEGEGNRSDDREPAASRRPEAPLFTDLEGEQADETETPRPRRGRGRPRRATTADGDGAAIDGNTGGEENASDSTPAPRTRRRRRTTSASEDPANAGESSETPSDTSGDANPQRTASADG